MKDAEIRPLVVRFGALGDMVMLIPSLEALARRYGAPVDVVTSGEWSHHLYDGLDFVGRVHVIGSRKTPYLLNPAQRQLVQTLSARNRGPCWVMELLDKVHWLIGKSGFREEQIVDRRRYPPFSDEHMVDYHFRLALIDPPDRTDLRPVSAPVPHLAVSAAEIEEARAWCDVHEIDPRHLVVIQAGNKRTMHGGWRRRPSNVKYWPEERWAAVVSTVLRNDPRFRIVMNATAEESSLVRDVTSRLSQCERARCVSRGGTSRQLAALLSIAHSCISVDSGPAHVAGAVGCPVLTLFGVTSPRLYCPRGREGRVLIASATPGRGLVVETDGRSWSPASTMSALEPSMVIEGWHRLTDAGSLDR